MSSTLRNFLLATTTQWNQAISHRYLGSDEQSHLVWNGFFLFSKANTSSNPKDRSSDSKNPQSRLFSKKSADGVRGGGVFGPAKARNDQPPWIFNKRGLVTSWDHSCLSDL